MSQRARAPWLNFWERRDQHTLPEQLSHWAATKVIQTCPLSTRKADASPATWGGAAAPATETAVTAQLLLYNENKILPTLLSCPLSSFLFVFHPWTLKPRDWKSRAASHLPVELAWTCLSVVEVGAEPFPSLEGEMLSPFTVPHVPLSYWVKWMF